MTKQRLVLLVGFILVLVAAFALLRKQDGAVAASVTSAAGPRKAGHRGSSDDKPLSATVRPLTVAAQNVRQMLDVTGSLKADEDVTLGSRIEGKVVLVTVKEGDHVERGQVLVKLDDRELRTVRARAAATLSAARARLSLAEHQATWQDVSAKSAYETAQATLNAATARLHAAETAFKLVDVQSRTNVVNTTADVSAATAQLAEALQKARKQELEEGRLLVAQAKARQENARVDMENAKQVFERRQQLYKLDAIAREEVDEAERKYKATQNQFQVFRASVESEEQKLSLVAEGSRPEEIVIAKGGFGAAKRNLNQARSDERKRDVAQEDIRSAQAAVEQAEAGLRAAKAGLIRVDVSQNQIATARAEIEQAKADLRTYETQIADLTTVAPVSGVVARRFVHVGEIVTKNTQLMNLVGLHTVYFQAFVPETEVSLIKPGAAADITIDSMPGRTFKGSVKDVLQVADATTRAYRVRIALPEGKDTLPPGGYARARLTVGLHTGVLAVSSAAVHAEAGDTYVWKVITSDNGGLAARRQPVRIGAADGDAREVLSGLKPGDRVLEGDPSDQGSAEAP